jgi:hypothetical protein
MGKSTSVLRSVGIAAVVSAAHAAELGNGSFESNTTDGGSTYQALYAGFAGLPGWRWSDEPSIVLIGNPPDNPGYAYATPFGQWQVDLSGSNNGTGGWLETDVTGLAPGGAYAVEFHFGTSAGFVTGDGPPSVLLTVNGTQPRQFSHQPAAIIVWTPFRYEFTAPASTAVLRFTDDAPSGTGLVSVDNVRLVAVPVAPSLSRRINPITGALVLEFAGVLETSTDLASWQPVTGAVSPHEVAFADGSRFFRANSE